MSHLIIFLILGVVLFVSYFLVETVAGFQGRRAARAEDPSLKETSGAGAFRSIYAFLVGATVLALLSLLFPLSLDFKNQVHAAGSRREAIEPLLKLSAIPVLMLVLLCYAGRRNLLRWIKEASWPRD